MLSRNRYFMIGVLLVMFGLQFRAVQSFVLNEPATRTLMKLNKDASVASNGPDLAGFIQEVAVPRPTKKVEPPRWVGLALVAFGAVITLHAVAMPKRE
jgi:hypothetical protein